MLTFDEAKTLNKADGPPLRKRDALGYMEAHDVPNPEQCASCRMWIKERKLCFWFTADKEVPGQASCIVYVPGQPITDLDAKPVGAVTPEEVGFVLGKVRCENCYSFDGESECGFFDALDKMEPKVWNLGSRVHPKACCNGFVRG